MCAILIVDDDASIRFAMADYFAAKGYRADSAESLREAQARLAADDYAIVITDLRLNPGSDDDGLRMVRHVHERHAGTGCIVLTAYGSAASEADARRHGAHAFLHKPQPLPMLLDIVNRLAPCDGRCSAAERNAGCTDKASASGVADTSPPTTSKEPAMAYETNDDVIELIWRDLAGQVERPRVAEIANSVAADIGNVKITAYLPLFVRRLAVERLLPEVPVHPAVLRAQTPALMAQAHA